jgi:hypothetical protein
MALYRILYWQKIPSQVRAWDDFDEVKVELSERAIQEIDRSAQKQGLTGTDAYLDQWNWGEEQEREGDPEEVAEAVRSELEATLDA